MSITAAWQVKDFERAKKNQQLFTTALNILGKYSNLEFLKCFISYTKF